MMQLRCCLQRVPCENENSNECLKRVFRNYEKYSRNAHQIRGRERFRVQGVGFESFGSRVSGFGPQSSGFRVSGVKFLAATFVFRLVVVLFRVSCLGLGFQVSDFGFRLL